MRRGDSKDQKARNGGGEHQSIREKERGVITQLPSSQCQCFSSPGFFSPAGLRVPMFRDGEGLQVWQPSAIPREEMPCRRAAVTQEPGASGQPSRGPSSSLHPARRLGPPLMPRLDQ